MAIAFRSASSKATGTGAVTPALPASMVSGDIVILCATTIAGGSISITANGSISSWTEITSGGLDVASGEKLYVWWGRWTSGTTGPTCTPGSDHCCAGTVAYSGCVPTGSPIGTSATSTEVTSDTSFSFATGISSGENNCLIICVASNGNDSNTATVGNMANTSLTSLANRQDFCTTSGGGGGYSLQEGVKATAGTMGTFTSTYSASTPKAYIAFNLRPVVAIALTVPVGTVVIDGVAPGVAVGNNINLSIPVGVITITGTAPTVAVSDNKNLTIPVGTIVIAGVVPTVFASDNKNFSISVGAVIIAGVAPTVSVSDNKNFSTAVGTIVIEGVAPTVSISDNKNFTIPVGEVSISGIASFVSVTNHINLEIPVGDVIISGVAPTLSISDNKNFDIGIGQVNIEGISPTVFASDHQNFLIPVGLISIEGIVPTLSISNHISLTIPTGEVIINGAAPSIGGNVNLQPGIGQILIQGVAPIVNATDHKNFFVDVGGVLIEGIAPSIQTPVNLNIPSGNITINGIAPSLGAYIEPIVVDSTVWIKFGKFSIMPCDPCAPKFIVSCLTDEPTDDFEFNIYGLADGVYYWRITEASTVLTKAFSHVEGTPLSIAVSDVPDGFFQTKRTFLFEILKTASSENPIPFLIGQYVEQLSIDIECNIYPSQTVGEDTTP